MAVSAFSPPERQVDRRVPLAGRLRHDLHARIEDLLAGQHELCLTAAEQHGKEACEILVDAVEGLLQELPRLAVDLPNGILERRHGFGQIRGLRIQVLLSLGRDPELVERGEIDGAEVGDRALQPLDLLRAADLFPNAFNAAGQSVEVGMRFGQLTSVLLFRQRHGLAP
jgi:hypothetical protein